MNEGVKKQNFPYGRDHVLMFAAAHLEHGHIYTQCDGLIRAGAVLKWVYEPDAGKRTAFLEKYPGVRTARSFDEILADPTIQIIAAAAVPSERAALGCRAMQAGKDYFTDKPGFTTLEQLWKHAGQARQPDGNIGSITVSVSTAVASRRLRI